MTNTNSNENNHAAEGRPRNETYVGGTDNLHIQLQLNHAHASTGRAHTGDSNVKHGESFTDITKQYGQPGRGLW